MTARSGCRLARHVDGKSRATARSFEDRADRPCALELVEARRACDQHDAVEELARGLSLGRRRHDRPEEGHLTHVDDGRADLVTDGVHARVVTLSQRLVVVGAGRGVRELGLEPDVAQRPAMTSSQFSFPCTWCRVPMAL